TSGDPDRELAARLLRSASTEGPPRMAERRGGGGPPQRPPRVLAGAAVPPAAGAAGFLAAAGGAAALRGPPVGGPPRRRPAEPPSVGDHRGWGAPTHRRPPAARNRLAGAGGAAHPDPRGVDESGAVAAERAGRAGSQSGAVAQGSANRIRRAGWCGHHPGEVD